MDEKRTKASGMQASLKDLYADLDSLAADAFPKRCTGCGNVFQDVHQFLRETTPVRQDHSGFKAGIDDADKNIVELFRNCKCGSTLLEFFSDRRDTSENGIRRREKFGRLLDTLVAKGADRTHAREVILRGMGGQEVDLMALIRHATTSGGTDANED
jgi:predicted  nucleic acid-binding Zn-ribbon protein